MYHPEFKHGIAPQDFEVGDITRTRSGPTFGFHPQKLLQDVVSLRIAVSASRRRQIEDLFSVIGFARSERDGASVWHGEDLEIEVGTATSAPAFALRSVGLHLTRPSADPAVRELGPSLRVRLPGDASAVLELR